MNCSHEGCTAATVGKSRYCREHRDAARVAWRERIQANSDNRAIRDAEFLSLWERAVAAGESAAAKARPVPCLVMQGDRVVGKLPGAYGCSWVKVYPGNSAFARWCDRNRPNAGYSTKRTEYGGGRTVYYSRIDSAYEIGVEFCAAFAAVLRGSGIRAYSGYRLD